MKNDSWSYPLETPLDDIFDHNHDGQLTGFETVERDIALHNIYSQAASGNKKSSTSTGFSTSKVNVDNQKVQDSSAVVFVLVVLFFAIISPLLTVIGLATDPSECFIKPAFLVALIITVMEIIALFVCLCVRIEHSCKVDLSVCKSERERELVAKYIKKDRKKKYAKFALTLCGIGVAVGLGLLVKLDISYRSAISETIVSEHTWSFHFDTKKHPNYKDAQGWGLYCAAKESPNNENITAFFNYKFRHTNAKQDEAIQDLKDELNKRLRGDSNSTPEGVRHPHALVGSWFCPSYESCNGGDITITVTQKGNTLHFSRRMIMSTAEASSNIIYEISVPSTSSFRVDSLKCTYRVVNGTLVEEFDNGRENYYTKEQVEVKQNEIV